MEKQSQYIDLGFAKLDTSRMNRIKQEEVVFGATKTTQQLLQITQAVIEKRGSILITKLRKDKFLCLQKKFSLLEYDNLAEIAWYNKQEKQKGKLAIITAGTSDIKIAREASITAEYFGIETQEYFDVGVASLERLAKIVPELANVTTIIVVAGMEGTLPTLVGSLLSQPIIAVPTSIGYGSHKQGEVPLHTSLNSCVPGITVVNIDNGFGAAMAALRIHNHLD